MSSPESGHEPDAQFGDGELFPGGQDPAPIQPDNQEDGSSHVEKVIAEKTVISREPTRVRLRMRLDPDSFGDRDNALRYEEAVRQRKAQVRARKSKRYGDTPRY